MADPSGHNNNNNHHHHAGADKEVKRKKQFKRMSKILAKAWEWDEAFQESSNNNDNIDVIRSLAELGAKLDRKAYKLGRHGWEAFAQDLGGVFNWHIQRKTNQASQAKGCLEKAKTVLGKIDESLAKLASDFCPAAASPNKKRKRSTTPPPPAGTAAAATTTTADHSSPQNRRRTKSQNKNSDLAQREERALELLRQFCVERGGDPSQVADYTARVTRSQSNHNKYDSNFYNPVGRRFRSMLEVGRFLGLVKADNKKGKTTKRRKTTSQSQEAEKRKLRKELERLRKAHQRATKALDDFTTDEKEGEPIDDAFLLEPDSSENNNHRILVDPTHCAAARVADRSGFPGVPQHCIPDVLITWDFLCTFERALLLTPIGLDDFVNALVYVPPPGQLGDAIVAPPVYLAEAHLALLKFLLQDRSSDDWWWSTLETDDVIATPQIEDETAADKLDETKPLIKVDMAALLAETEDPLITTSWLRALENGQDETKSTRELKAAIRTALRLVSNKWVLAYLLKALKAITTNGAAFGRRAVLWLVDRVKEARPDLFDSSVRKEKVFAARKKVVDETSKLMNELADTAPTVKDEDVSDAEYEEDEDSDDSDDEEDDMGSSQRGLKSNDDESERVASSIPPRPLPSYVDMLLPPAKPHANDDFVSVFTWPELVGATLSRTLHRRKRLFNEVDDSIRQNNQLPPLKVPERRERERIITSRVLMECIDSEETAAKCEKAIEKLCTGENYLQLSVLERLCILRLLIEAAYDTLNVYGVVSGNYKQRASAMKALDVEQRRAKREAKEKAAADEAAAREQLAADVREKFLDEQREEIRKLNDKSKEFSDEVMESLTSEDIIDFDDDIKADYEALPGPESFNKAEVSKMVKRMQEEAAFDTDALRVITMDELLERDKRDLEEMEGQLVGFGGENALLDPSLDRETVRSIERLRRDIEKAKIQAEKLPAMREKALEQLKDAMADGTIKVLRAALTAAKKAKLTGTDDETGGLWAVDMMRDAALELEKAKQNKRVVDAQKELVAKRNRCFIRNPPLGQDRFGNRFWNFGAAASSHIWADAEYSLKPDDQPRPPLKSGFVDLLRDPKSITVGTEDMESDFVNNAGGQMQMFRRQEYHSSGFSSALVKRHWGCHVTEDSLRGVIKLLDSRGIQENDLKSKLKDALDEIVETDERPEAAKEEADEDDNENGVAEAEADTTLVQESGDETSFATAKETAKQKEEPVSGEFETLASAIGSNVRVRLEVDGSKSNHVARYENGKVTGWKIQRDKVEVPSVDPMQEDGDEEEPSKPQVVIREVSIWRVQTESGKALWFEGAELVESLARHEKWKEGQGYFEADASFFAYRNPSGRHCGRAAEAPYASSPNFLARLMVNRESDLYPKLKIRSYDNNWGGKSGARALWTNSMKDYAYDFTTVQQGLLTLEGAFFELTGEFAEYGNVAPAVEDIQAVLNDPVQRIEIELESIERSVPGLWNSPLSRAVFKHLVETSKTTGFLALALDLLCRNTTAYLRRHKLLNVRTETAASASLYETTTRRSTRRMNAWQQQQIDAEYHDW